MQRASHTRAVLEPSVFLFKNRLAVRDISRSAGQPRVNSLVHGPAQPAACRRLLPSRSMMNGGPPATCPCLLQPVVFLALRLCSPRPRRSRAVASATAHYFCHFDQRPIPRSEGSALHEFTEFTVSIKQQLEALQS